MSQVAVENVILELNGLRQRVGVIKEEIAKTSKSLNEQAQQLNDLVSKSMNQLKEQFGGTTLSGFLSLQARYRSGDISDSDYKSQKDYYRTEIGSMIRKLDDSKRILMLTAELVSPATTPART